MAYRPYPNADRARRMIDRHEFEEPPASVEPMVSPFTIHLTEAAQVAAEGLGRSVAQMLARVAQTEPGDYVLSTRRPGSVGDGPYS
ncbi:hypothetical protein ACFWH4_01600 [Streptomyces sp. NPDC127091]|uniref:hypothetical protein n=1 Tax=Streptomyces sp. NPDC127091 TaxID=3347134 RepID=UPI0036475927